MIGWVKLMMQVSRISAARFAGTVIFDTSRLQDADNRLFCERAADLLTPSDSYIAFYSHAGDHRMIRSFADMQAVWYDPGYRGGATPESPETMPAAVVVSNEYDDNDKELEYLGRMFDVSFIKDDKPTGTLFPVFETLKEDVFLRQQIHDAPLGPRKTYHYLRDTVRDIFSQVEPRYDTEPINWQDRLYWLSNAMRFLNNAVFGETDEMFFNPASPHAVPEAFNKRVLN